MLPVQTINTVAQSALLHIRRPHSPVMAIRTRAITGKRRGTDTAHRHHGNRYMHQPAHAVQIAYRKPHPVPAPQGSKRSDHDAEHVGYGVVNGAGSFL
jgi:hypothetical protein